MNLHLSSCKETAHLHRTNIIVSKCSIRQHTVALAPSYLSTERRQRSWRSALSTNAHSLNPQVLLQVHHCPHMTDKTRKQPSCNKLFNLRRAGVEMDFDFLNSNIKNVPRTIDFHLSLLCPHRLRRERERERQRDRETERQRERQRERLSVSLQSSLETMGGDLQQDTALMMSESV